TVNCSSGTCVYLAPLGAQCSSFGDCVSGRCDAGIGTTNTSRCIPNDGTGNIGDFCTHPHQCANGNCVGGVGAAPVALAATCHGNSECQSGRCDAGFGTMNSSTCIPNDGTGRAGDYCNHPHQCTSGSCVASHCTAQLASGHMCQGNSDCLSGRCNAGF